MEEEQIDDLTGVAAGSKNCRTKTAFSVQSKPTFHVDDVETRGAAVPEAGDEPEPQMKSIEVKYELLDDPMETETSDVSSQDQQSVDPLHLTLYEERSLPNDPELYNVVLSDSSHSGKIVTGNVGMACFSDPLRLKTSEEHSQDSDPPRSSGPKEIPVQNKRFTCDVCGYKTNKKGTFEDHLRIHTGEKPFACDSCDYRSSSKHTLSKHKKTHLRQKPVKCSMCDFRGNVRSVSGHMKIHSMGGTENEFRVPSGSCGPNEIPVIIKRFTCDVCGYKADGKGRFEDHLRTHTGEKPFACDSCDYKASSKSLLVQHKTTHSWPKPFKCDLCDYSASVSSDLSRHMNTHVSGYTLHKGVCTPSTPSDPLQDYGPPEMIKLVSPNEPLEFREVYIMNNGLSESSQPGESVTEDVGMPCSKDDPMQKEFASNHATDGTPHYPSAPSTSSGPKVIPFTDRRFACDCGFETDGKAALEVHIRTHTAEKPFACDSCEYRASSKGLLAQHKNGHAMPKPFKCDLCDYTGSTQSALSRHMNTHVSGYAPKGVFTPMDTLKVHGTPVIVKLASPNGPLQFSEVYSTNGLSESSQSGETVTEDVAIPCSKNDPKEPLNDQSHAVPQEICTIFSCDYEPTSVTSVEPDVSSTGFIGAPRATAPDLVQQPNSAADLGGFEETTTSLLAPPDDAMKDVLLLGSRTESSNEPPGSDLNYAHDEPPNEPLKAEQSEEHSEDNIDNPSFILEPEAVTGNKRFRCGVCGYTNKRHELEVHLRTHTGETPFACDLCDKRYIAKKTLNRHKKAHHGEKPLDYVSSDYTSAEKPDLTEHAKVKYETASDSFEASQVKHGSPSNSFDGSRTECDEEAHFERTAGSMKLEQSDEHSHDGGPSWSYEIADTGNNCFTCDVCGFTTQQKRSYEVHLMTHAELFACEFCGRKYNAKRTLDRHMRECHGENLFACGLCYYRATKKSDLTEHVKTHCKYETESDFPEAGEVKHPSPNASFELVDLNEVSNYSGPSESSQPENDPLKTEFNEARYEPTNDPLRLEVIEEHSQDSSLSRSSEVEAFSIMNKRFTCEVCGYKTNRKYEFTVHLRTHSGEKPYGCSLCGYRSIKKSYVNKHMKTHARNEASNGRSQVELLNESKNVVLTYPLMSQLESNEASENSIPSESARPGRRLSGDEHFTCEHCEYKCDDITAWSQHMFEHTKEKSLNCDGCEFETKGKWRMDAHRKECAGNKSVRITCEFCDYLFTTKTDMSQHITTFHPEKCPHSCDVCNFKAFNVRSLELHKETHTKPYACNICDYRAKEERDLASHVEVTHQTVKLFACTICDYKVDEESLLARHVMSAHADVEEFVCYYCDYKSSDVKDVEQHISTAHKLRKLSTAESSSFVCVTDGMPSSEIDASIPQPVLQQYLCYACDFKASEVAHVEEHILSTHSVPGGRENAVPLASLNPQLPGDYLVAPASSNAALEEYCCYACDYKASSVAQVEQHIVSSHSATMSESTASPMDVSAEASRSITSL